MFSRYKYMGMLYALWLRGFVIMKKKRRKKRRKRKENIIMINEFEEIVHDEMQDETLFVKVVKTKGEDRWMDLDQFVVE